MKGVSTVIATILMLMITIALAGMAYVYLSGLVPGTMGKMISVTSATCSNATGKYYVVIRNQDPRLSMDFSTELTIFIDGIPVPPSDISWSPKTVGPGETSTATINESSNYLTTPGTMHKITVTGPTNSEEKSAFC